MFEVNKISKTYTPKVKDSNVLSDINFFIKPGEVFSILGKNGAGKSTLIKILTTLLEADSGEVMYNGKNIKKILNKYKKSFGVVFERSDNMYDYLNIIENLLYFGGLSGLSNKYILERTNYLLDKFDLSEHKEKKLSHYSQGMQQKAAIINALLHKPKLLFLDEPTLGLDVVSKRKIISEIKNLSREENISILLTSHQLDVVEEVADRLMILSDHKIFFVGTVYDLKTKHSDNKWVIKIDKCKFIKKAVEKAFDHYKEIENNDSIVIEVYDELSHKELMQSILNYNIEITSVSKEMNTLENIMFDLLKEEACLKY